MGEKNAPISRGSDGKRNAYGCEKGTKNKILLKDCDEPLPFVSNGEHDLLNTSPGSRHSMIYTLLDSIINCTGLSDRPGRITGRWRPVSVLRY